MAAVQHEPVAEEVVQFLPAPPPLPLVQPPSQHSQQLTYPSSWPLHCRHGVFFSFSSSSFLPLSKPANKSLALSPGFFFLYLSACCSFTLSLPNTLSISTVLYSGSSFRCASPPPLPFSLSPPPRSALLLGAECVRAPEPIRLLLPQRAGLKRSAWELSPSLSRARLSLHGPMWEQRCGR